MKNQNGVFIAFLFLLLVLLAGTLSHSSLNLTSMVLCVSDICLKIEHVIPNLGYLKTGLGKRQIQQMEAKQGGLLLMEWFNTI